ncbi:GerMN domain-containing protein [Blastococcus montanus]|uniref:GerMN domain-containing protein n=1 Tax=Blastococcus montanus TaxID=3144973 RepID=UPI003208B84A
MRLLAGLLALLVVLTGCGVDPQPDPELLTIQAPPVTEGGRASADRGPELTVYFVAGADLAPVSRATDVVTPAAALARLTAGPTRAEVIGGVRTALAPQELQVDEGLPGGITSVSVTREFTGISGGNQLLAVAQVVWTLTDLPGTTRVRFLLDGVPVEVPTDEGLTEEPVARDHYRSVAPAGAAGDGNAPLPSPGGD